MLAVKKDKMMARKFDVQEKHTKKRYVSMLISIVEKIIKFQIQLSSILLYINRFRIDLGVGLYVVKIS